MARRRNRKKSGIDPAVMSAWFQVGDRNNAYVDLSQCATTLNRRFYRAGLNWAVSGFRIGYKGSRTNPVTICVQTLPTTWCVGATWDKFFHAWKTQQDDALDSSLSIDTKAKWNDFKIYYDAAHKTAGNETPVVPGGFGTSLTQYPHTLGEWQYSNIVVPNDVDPGDAVEYSLWMLGDDAAGGKGMIKNYALSRNYPQSPDPVNPDVAESVLSEMFDLGDNYDEIVDNATGTNDETPYSQVYYPGVLTTTGSTGYLHHEIQFYNESVNVIKTIPGCMVPCGLLKFSHDGDSLNAADIVIQVLFAPGANRGYLTQPMGEMN